MSRSACIDPNLDAGARGRTRRRGAAGGFTLIETLVVLAILGMLLGITAMAVGRYRESGRITQCRARVEGIGLLVESYADRMGAYPPDRLSHFDLKDCNTINEGIEALVAALKSPAYSGRRPDERWLANGDGDRSDDLRLFDGSRTLLELVDPWDNPFVYITNASYGSESTYRLVGDLGEEFAVAVAARNPLTDTWHRFESYQLVSAGPDGLLGTEDDLANYLIEIDDSD